MEKFLMQFIQIYPNFTITNLSSRVLTNHEYETLQYGLKHCTVIKPKDNEIFPIAEDIYDQIDRKSLCKENHISIQGFTFNILDKDDKTDYSDFKKLKVIKNLWKDVEIVKAHKGNGVVFIYNVDYYQTLEQLFIDKKKFKQINKDLTMTQLSTFQSYLRSLFKRGELAEQQYKNLRPQNTRAERAHALPKIRKTFTVLPKFTTIVDTTSTCYYNVASYLTGLLNPLAQMNLLLEILLMLPTKSNQFRKTFLIMSTYLLLLTWNHYLRM